MLVHPFIVFTIEAPGCNVRCWPHSSIRSEMGTWKGAAVGAMSRCTRCLVPGKYPMARLPAGSQPVGCLLDGNSGVKLGEWFYDVNATAELGY